MVPTIREPNLDSNLLLMIHVQGSHFLQLLPSRISSLFPLQKDLVSFSHLRRGRNRPAESTFLFSGLEQQVVDKGAVVTFLVRSCNSTFSWQRSEMLGGRKKGEKPTLLLLLENKKERNCGRASPELLRI